MQNLKVIDQQALDKLLGSLLSEHRGRKTSSNIICLNVEDGQRDLVLKQLSPFINAEQISVLGKTGRLFIRRLEVCPEVSPEVKPDVQQQAITPMQPLRNTELRKLTSQKARSNILAALTLGFTDELNKMTRRKPVSVGRDLEGHYTISMVLINKATRDKVLAEMDMQLASLPEFGSDIKLLKPNIDVITLILPEDQKTLQKVSASLDHISLKTKPAMKNKC